MLILEGIPLATYTTFRIGGQARFFATARSEQNVISAVAFARQRSLPIFVLGGGSNLLVADRGFEGLVLHIALHGVAEEQTGSDQVLVSAGAGEDWDRFVQYTVERQLAGIECLAGIPGSVGGTPVQNVGAYGQEIAETVASVRAFDLEQNVFVVLDQSACGFAYRTSIFNTTHRGRYIVTRVDFELVRAGAPKILYGDLVRYFAATGTDVPSLREVAAAVRQIRNSKGMYLDPGRPEDVDTHSAGSFFRNPVVAADRLPHIAASAGVQPDQVPHWPVPTVQTGNPLPQVKLASAWLLQNAGFHRGYALGNAGISSKHALALINRGGATAGEILALRDRIVAEVESRFGVRLEQEPVMLG